MPHSREAAYALDELRGDKGMGTRREYLCAFVIAIQQYRHCQLHASVLPSAVVLCAPIQDVVFCLCAIACLLSNGVAVVVCSMTVVFGYGVVAVGCATVWL
jgi:hypothetical protein